MTKSVYITTAIPYVNGQPHVGHLLDYLDADVCARYHRLLGHAVRFQAGTDEHGNKIAQKAAESGLTPQKFADQNSQKFQDFIHLLHISNTDFIRTTDPDHQRRCQAIWQKLSPHIYQDTYEGWYCDGCEAFVTQKEYDANDGICPDHQRPYTRLSEQNYYLRISDFRDQIAKAIEDKALHILPEFRAKEILELLKDTPDVSISRPREHLDWGVPVPGDDSQVMYVWVDALSNYLTVLGYPDRDISDFWPAEVQVVGKDILRFHTIIWPAILLGLGLELPKTIISHGFITVDGQKISKSLGNTIDPLDIINRYGLPACRYYFLRHVDTFADSDFSWDKFDAAYNGELANDYGNLVQRLATLAAKNHINLPADLRNQYSPHDITASANPPKSPQNIPQAHDDYSSHDIIDYANSVTDHPPLDPAFCDFMNNYEFSKALDFTWSRLQDINRAIDAAKPWALAKEGKTAELTQTMQTLITDLLAVNYHLTPFLPDTAAAVAAIFTAPEIQPPASPLFPKR